MYAGGRSRCTAAGTVRSRASPSPSKRFHGPVLRADAAAARNWVWATARITTDPPTQPFRNSPEVSTGPSAKSRERAGGHETKALTGWMSWYRPNPLPATKPGPYIARYTGFRLSGIEIERGAQPAALSASRIDREIEPIAIDRHDPGCLGAVDGEADAADEG